jgi:hypothetical protein
MINASSHLHVVYLLFLYQLLLIHLLCLSSAQGHYFPFVSGLFVRQECMLTKKKASWFFRRISFSPVLI